MDQLDSASQLVYNGMEFNWVQVIGYQGAPDIKIDGALFDVYGYQKWRREKSHPFSRLELVPNGGRLIVIVGEWFEDAEVQQQGGAGQGGANTAINELDSGPIAVVAGTAATPLIGANNARIRGVTVQNVGLTAVALGRTAALAQSLAGGGIILAPGAAANDGNGDAVDFDGWQGGVWAVNVAGGPGSVLVSAY